MTKFLTGYGVPPVIVGIARGALIAGAIAIVEALISTLTSASLPASPWLIAAPFIVAALRGAEGALDGLQKPPAAPPTTPAPPVNPTSTTPPA
jgi:hypothetical protein